MSNTKQAKPTQQLLDPKVVKRELFERGWSQARLAVEIGHSVTSVNGAINHGFFPRVAAKIKALLQL
jgi:ribosome-binding protein aMBF1 (putative translation factor)